MDSFGLDEYWVTYTECPVIKPPVGASFEEVSVAVSVLQGSINIVWDSIPIGDRLGVGGLDRRPLSRVEPPEFGSFIEVDFSVARPN